MLRADEEILTKINDENKQLMDDFIEYLVTTDHSPKTLKVYKLEITYTK